MTTEAQPVRIRVIGGPWPERVGCEGHVVHDPGHHIYPFDKPRPKTERVIKLDSDPLEAGSDRYWTCVIQTRALEFI